MLEQVKRFLTIFPVIPIAKGKKLSILISLMQSMNKNVVFRQKQSKFSFSSKENLFTRVEHGTVDLSLISVII